MTDVKKKEEGEEAPKAGDNIEENIEVDPNILKDAEGDKDANNLDDENEEYHRKSFHAREYKSPTIEQTQQEVEDYIVKNNR